MTRSLRRGRVERQPYPAGAMLAGATMLILATTGGGAAWAEGPADVTGSWEIHWSSSGFPDFCVSQVTFTQTGTALSMNPNACTFGASGTIDSGTGSFSLDLPIPRGGCGITGTFVEGMLCPDTVTGSGLCSSTELGTFDLSIIGKRLGAEPGCPADGNPCTADLCDPVTAACSYPPGNAGVVCRPGAAVCDAAEVCSGSDPDCPPDQPAIFGTPCNDDVNICTDDVCNGAGTCVHLPNDSPCSDGNNCTSGDRCEGGMCVTSGVVDCGDPCIPCIPAIGCIARESIGCQMHEPGKTQLIVRNGDKPKGDFLRWRWTGERDGPGVEKAGFGSPTTSTDMTLCVFDQTGLKMSATMPADGTCRGRDCWSDLATGFRYRDPELDPDGVRGLELRAGPPSRAKIAVRGEGANLDVPPLGLTLPAFVRLQRNEDAMCWQASYGSPTANDPDRFRAIK